MQTGKYYSLREKANDLRIFSEFRLKKQPTLPFAISQVEDKFPIVKL